MSNTTKKQQVKLPQDEHISCSICLLTDPRFPMIAACKHIYCSACIKLSLERSPKCALCSKPLEPYKNKRRSPTIADIDQQIESLQEKRRLLLESKGREVVKLQLEFMIESKNQKLHKKKEIEDDIAKLDKDIMTAHEAILKNGGACPNTPRYSKRIKLLKRGQAEVIEQPSSKYNRILQNFTDLENNYFVFGGKYRKKIGKIISDAFRYDSGEIAGTIAFSGTEASPVKVSSIKISKDNLLAMAGSRKSVNIYRHSDLGQTPLPLLYPSTKLTTKAFNWSLSWNMMQKNLLAVGDFESDISVWDVSKETIVNSFQEHTASKFISTSFSYIESQQLLSAGFDGYVKVWKLNEPRSCLTISSPDKILNLATRPWSQFHFTVSSINKNLYTYDIRKADKPVGVLTGHTRSVFQLNYLSTQSIISASVDGTLKQWNYDSCQCVRTYRGHTNSSKFIGLDVHNSLIACGSEDNHLVLYHEALSKPVFSFKFPESRTVLEHTIEDGNERQITAITWSGDDLCVANDHGVMYVLKLKEES